MSLTKIKELLPDYAKDIKLNLAKIFSDNDSGLSDKQIYSIALASAYASRSQNLVQNLFDEAKNYLHDSEINAIKGSATIMAMNNIYYRFTHLVNDKEYTTMPANLRMSIIANPGMDKIDFELCCLAVSAINGCGKCIDAHVVALNKTGVNKLAIQSAIRIAAVITAAALGVEGL